MKSNLHRFSVFGLHASGCALGASQR